MPAVTHDFNISITNDPAVNAIDVGKRAIYLDMLLSEYYGKMVRQGNSFAVKGIQASIKPDPASSGIDVGMSVQASLSYIPTTKHSKFAWNQVYKGWRNQKKLATAVGGQIRYDDLEFGWNKHEYEGRTSTIFGSGMEDGLQEKLVLTGQSIQTAGVDVGQYSLEAYYNDAYETPAASRDPFTDTDIKEAKWGATPFPEVQTMNCSCSSSAVADPVPTSTFSGAITTGPVETLPTQANVLCGVIFAEAFVMPDDTLGQDEDDFILTITIFVTSWKPLIFHRRKSRRGRSRRRGGWKGARRGKWSKRSRRRR